MVLPEHQECLAITISTTGAPAEGSRILEKADPHSGSTSRSDSPVESSERKKKHKRKDKEKREKVKSTLTIYQYPCCNCGGGGSMCVLNGLLVTTHTPVPSSFLLFHLFSLFYIQEKKCYSIVPQKAFQNVSHVLGVDSVV